MENSDFFLFITKRAIRIKVNIRIMCETPEEKFRKEKPLKKHFTTLSYYIEWFSDLIMGNVFSRINKFADHIENIVSINCIGLNRSKDMKRTVTSIHTSQRAHNCTHTHILTSFCSLPPANGVAKFLICTIFLFNFFFIFFIYWQIWNEFGSWKSIQHLKIFRTNTNEQNKTKIRRRSNWLIKTRINTFELNLLIEPITGIKNEK